MLYILLWLTASLLLSPFMGKLLRRRREEQTERWRKITHWQELIDRAEIERGRRMLK